MARARAQEMLRTLAQDSHVALDFVVDLHSHSTAMNAFCYVNLVANDLARCCACSHRVSRRGRGWEGGVGRVDDGSCGEVRCWHSGVVGVLKCMV